MLTDVKLTDDVMSKHMRILTEEASSMQQSVVVKDGYYK